MKKIVFASLLLLSAAGFFFACQKETVVTTATEVAASNTESITQRDDETPCSLQVTISGALGTYLCGTLPADPIPGDARCTVCLNDYSIFIINSNAVTRTMLGNVFSIKNPTNVSKSITFAVTGASCSTSLPPTILPAGSTKSFRIAFSNKPAPGCCRVIEDKCK